MNWIKLAVKFKTEIPRSGRSCMPRLVEKHAQDVGQSVKQSEKCAVRYDLAKHS